MKHSQPDIAQLTMVRLSVQENRLSNPARVTAQDYTEYLTRRGKGRGGEVMGSIVGFGSSDVMGHSIRAFFVQPEFAGQGIGKRLHTLMLEQVDFAQTAETIWLSTAPSTRAGEFYRRQGWQAVSRLQAEQSGLRCKQRHENEQCQMMPRGFEAV